MPENPDRLGVLLGPGKNFCRSMIAPGVVYAADNGCFTGLDRSAILRMLAGLLEFSHLPLFVTCPDVVADPAATRKLFVQWGVFIRSLGLPVAYVGQDGVRVESVPWSDVDAYFVGGSDDWKLSRESHAVACEARSRHKILHMGRVNSLKRIKEAAAWRCDTIDGTGFTWYSDKRVPLALNWMKEALNEENHPVLFAS